MFLINIRRDGIDGNTFSHTQQLFQLDVGRSLYSVEESDLMREVEGKNMLVLIHGFNNSTQDILSLYRRLTGHSKAFFRTSYDAIVGLIWPGGESEFSYFQSRQNARQSGHYLKAWFRKFTKAGCTIDAIGHSMATIVGYHALQSEATIRIRNIFSMGAAISQAFLIERVTDKLMSKIENLYLFYTKQDDILKYWFRIVELREAVGYSGLERYEEHVPHYQKLTLIDCSDVIRHHSGYWTSETVFECIGEILAGKRLPQSYKLLPGLRRVFDRFLSAEKSRSQPQTVIQKQ